MEGRLVLTGCRGRISRQHHRARARCCPRGRRSPPARSSWECRARRPPAKPAGDRAGARQRAVDTSNFASATARPRATSRGKGCKKNRSRTQLLATPQARLRPLIDGARKAVILTHVHTDGDGIGAEILTARIHDLARNPDPHPQHRSRSRQRYALIDTGGVVEVFDPRVTKPSSARRMLFLIVMLEQIGRQKASERVGGHTRVILNPVAEQRRRHRPLTTPDRAVLEGTSSDSEAQRTGELVVPDIIKALRGKPDFRLGAGGIRVAGERSPAISASGRPRARRTRRGPAESWRAASAAKGVRGGVERKQRPQWR